DFHVTGVQTCALPISYVSIGTPIVNLEKIDVLKLDFKLPEAALTQISPGQSVTVEVDAIPGRTFSAEIYAINPMMDVNGRALHRSEERRVGKEGRSQW